MSRDRVENSLPLRKRQEVKSKLRRKAMADQVSERVREIAAEVERMNASMYISFSMRFLGYDAEDCVRVFKQLGDGRMTAEDVQREFNYLGRLDEWKKANGIKPDWEGAFEW